MSEVIVTGLDLGTNTTVLVSQEKSKAKSAGKAMAGGTSGNAKVEGVQVTEEIFRSVIGIPKPTILPGILPRGKKPLFGEEAIKYKMHLDLHWPIQGTVVDTEHARLLVESIRERLDPKGDKEVCMVIGSPANASSEELASIRSAVAGIIDKILIVPEPFLAAMGYRDEDKLTDPDYSDPVANTLFVDIGAGTTDLCKVQGYYPTEEDLISIAIAGNYVDKKLQKHLQKTYPDARFADVVITKLKEDNSYVGSKKKSVVVKVPVHGKHRELDITQAIKESCEELVEPIVENIEEMARRCDPEAVEGMLENIVLTGGGSQISGLAQAIEKALHKEDYLSAKVRCVEDYKPLVARGAMKTGLKLKDDQWTIPM